MSDEDLKQKSFLNLVLTGRRLLMIEQFQRARHIFTSALELQPEDKECLIGRSKCCMNEGRLRKALQDAELSLRHDKSFPEGLYQKAQVLYSLGELEFSLQLYYQGQHVRPQMQCFELGIQRARDAIENSVGSLTNVPLKVGGDLSFLENMELRTHPIKIIQNLMKEEKTEAPEVPKKKQTTPNLLKDFTDPKTFLADLVKHGDLMKDKTKSGEEVKEIVEDLLMSVNTYKEICNQENMVAPPEKKPQQPEAEGLTVSECEEFLLRSFCEIVAELKSGDEESGLKKAKGVVKFVQRRSEMELPPKKRVLCSLDGFIGDALLCRRANEMEDRQNDHDLTEQCKLPEAKSRAEGGSLQETAELLES
ncbi:tetratricopeptide repeat protein 25-like isoform X2 [Oryzias latipes]|uniref:tetratricopeptide repeat protein 25-like isoform X2 n=1 Tax=Oryzias latipes TaxID=8090 RepID=UPI0009D9E380|nr:tetratricopeptide repeat protein 25-like isoform X2 [Oryzias latipes]XP_020561169.1 tetratricopeptide repeat protein 25-like isoform X2 [Oryzias latipes]XP_023812921.1 tetratricopeptide repeat protein 25-like isoform X2 [Oryzias latipes]